MATTIERIAKILIDSFGMPHTEIVPQAHMADDLGLDELDRVEVFMAAEEEFGIYIPHDDEEKTGTVGELVALVDRLAAA